MQRDPLFPQQELAQTYQLGALENEYVMDPRKLLAGYAFSLVFVLIAPFILFGLFLRDIDPTPLILPAFIFFFVVGGGITLIYYFAYRGLRVYVYTNGFLYSNGNTRRIIYWQQVKRAFTNRGFLHISISNEAGISIPTFILRFGELRARIKQEIARSRYPR